MSLFVVALLVIAAIGVVFWLMVRPGIDERVPTPMARDGAEQAATRYPRGMDDSRSPIAFNAAHERDRRGGAERIRDSTDTR
jgi:hypothetical protein